MADARGTRGRRRRESSQEWWKHDHFNVRAFNTLEKLYTQWIPNEYESHTEGIFDIRYPKAERAGARALRARGCSARRGAR